MELKGYQQKVITDLNDYLEYVQTYKRIDIAFNKYWEDKIGEFNPITGTGMKPYTNSVPGAVHVCIKVPTAGGKTFIACNGLKTIFNAFDYSKPKVVVWLVPWSNLLQQTVQNLSSSQHPYRQKLNALFNGRVEVYEKKDLLQAINFNPTIVSEQLSILVLNFASIRAKKKEDRKIYEENGQLLSFTEFNKDNSLTLHNTDETALINVIRNLNPVLILDESHNAESELSTDMLQNLNPSFILDLTATPKDKSNIITFVNAMELKKEHMVKLPVIAYNHNDKNEVINSALNLQKKLEILSQLEEKDGGKYIRPIILFQAQPKTKDENIDFHKLKEKLLTLNIPEEQIKIKTAEIDQLKGINLLDKSCPVRYIITVNALKEGWDCPFAYILASLADKSSAVDVEQILGRILRQPYVMKHKNFQLNLSYVLTASSKFNDTLQNIVKGLQNAGFSRNDYRSSNKMTEDAANTFKGIAALSLFPEQKITSALEDEIDSKRVFFNPMSPDISAFSHPIHDIENLAKETNEEFEKRVLEQESTPGGNSLFNEMPEKVKKYKMRGSIAAEAKTIKLPQFYLYIPKTDLFFEGLDSIILNQEALLDGFKLSNKDADVKFENIRSDIYKIDLEEVRKEEYSPKFIQIDDQTISEPLSEYILSKPKKERIKDIAHMMVRLIGDMYPIPDQEIKKYVERIIEDMSIEQLQDILLRKYSYSDKVKKKIKILADDHAEKKFRELIQAGKISMKFTFELPEDIIPGKLGPDIANSLYEREGDMNNFEAKVMTNLASLPNIKFWHRNLGRAKGFPINGFKSYHYPDFLIVTVSNKIILLETKGDDRDNSDSAAKNRLGLTWANEAGKQFRYFMVFENNKIENTFGIDDVRNIIKQL